MIFQLPIKLNLSDIYMYMIYLQQLDPLKFDAKHALKIMFFDCDALNRSVKHFFFRLSLSVVLVMNLL